MASMTVAEFCQAIQKRYGGNVMFSDARTSGPDHTPTVEVTMTVPPFDNEYIGVGSNKKIAKQECVNQAIAANVL